MVDGNLTFGISAATRGYSEEVQWVIKELLLSDDVTISIFVFPLLSGL